MLTALVSIFYYIILLVWSLVYFVFMLVVFALTVLFDRERTMLHIASRFWARSIFFLNPLWRLCVTGKDNIDPSKAYVITVNHQSMLDIPLMYALPCLNFKWVSKQGVYKWPLFGVVLATSRSTSAARFARLSDLSIRALNISTAERRWLSSLKVPAVVTARYTISRKGHLHWPRRQVLRYCPA